ncbi:hypothetical protein AaE_011211 [Aphanomyces astaci]|uniref:AB hydrolase-1 domain-containing protein n=2 Tax=Aphanomyces astaci TaxID=112090 RepID=A0A6A5A0I4_APHAT|nr:hypothetical protein AaE_011211 [Aphanomyces astaci]
MSGQLRFDGWYACSESTFDASVNLAAECGKYTLPLCHPGVCSDDTRRTLDVFVKRIRAVNSTNPKILWMLQGGPGYASADLDSWLADMYTLQRGQVTVMTMDHRGVGRSSYLSCPAAQATTSGSPGGRAITPDELPACLANVQHIYGAANAAGFSITSAATDLLTIISATSSPTQEVYVYGVSYGTIWVQRAMLVLPHLFPSLHNIRGFVLDGVVTHSGPHRTVFSDWDVNHGIVATKYFDLCQQNAFCASKFPDMTLYDTTLLLYVKLNAASHACKYVCRAIVLWFTTSKYIVQFTPKFGLQDIRFCRGLHFQIDLAISMDQYLCALVKTNFGDADGLKMLFSEYLQHSTLRVLIPVLVYRLQRCQTADIVVLQTMLNSVQELMDAPHMATSFYSELVRNVIGYSDLWELPTPTQAVLQAKFDQNVVASGMVSSLTEYCIYTGATDPACVATDSTYQYNHSISFTYPPDAYFNQTVAHFIWS